jgi:site-specific recombinase XerD
MDNDELFKLYDSDLMLRLHNAKNLSDTRKMLARFKEYLNGYPPSPELAKGFLAQYASKKPRTLYRYSQMIKIFMKWYGEPMDEFKVKVPKTLPPYTEDAAVEKLFSAIENKKTHKGCIVRDMLLVELDRKTGMRRGELANLEPREIHADFLVVRDSKNHRDRVIPLSPSIAMRLHNFIEGMAPDEKVFKLKAPCISNKIRQFAKKAGLVGFHTHTLRHKFATDLLEKGANIKVVQELLGHENLATTEVYLSIVNQSLKDAVRLLDDREEEPQQDKHKTKGIAQETGGALEDKVVAPPSCFVKDEWGCCSNVALRSDCSSCYYLRLGRTKDDIERLIALSLSLPTKVQQAKESFLAQASRKMA